MSVISFSRLSLVALALAGAGLAVPAAQAQTEAQAHAAANGGVSLGSTRVIYPQGNNQVSLAVNNTDPKATFLIQSWVENASESKSSDFVITPPLFVMKPQKENTLRIMYVGPNNLPADRESLYWVNVKAIPSAAKDTKGKNALQIAVLSRIKLFVRPKNLPMASIDAPAKLRFHESGNTLTVKNPTPYYMTLVQIHAGTATLPTTMVAPMSQADLKLPANAQGNITFQTINDYGANSPEQKAIIE
ncbi:fimbria/pilus periplasmic chaperone [Klebsiella michiganensis]|uniref:fimbria/pilus periplasmic chaperone n=1 Tax=Klebsiella michiganensis TaxID=1134687 RepID=UPI0034D1CF6C